MTLFNILTGLALLLFGRRLFWVFVAGVGFVVGAMLATEWMGGQSEGLILVIALAVGIIGAIASVFLQKAVVAVAGFMAGGYLLYTLALGVQYQSLAWIGFVVGGVLGAILVVVLFDWALIALSVLTGAAVITRNAHLEPLLSVLLFVVLLVTGVVIQTRQLASARTPRAV